MRVMERKDNVGWKVVYVASRQEKAVAGRLEKEGIVHFLPVVKQLRRWSDRNKWVELPLFPGYLIVAPDNVQYDRVLQIPGVVSYVRFNGAAAVVRNDEVEAIQRLITIGYDIEAVGLPDNTPDGSAVRITQGALKGLSGIVLHAVASKNFIILLEGINQGIRVSLPAEVLEKMES